MAFRTMASGKRGKKVCLNEPISKRPILVNLSVELNF